MKQKITLSYEVSYGPEDRPANYCGTERKLVIDLPGDITLPELLEQFEYFIKGIGYFPPNNAHLDYVDNNTDEPKLTP
jgi:hypothetical protein